MKNLSSLSSFDLRLRGNKGTRVLFKNLASFKNLHDFEIHFDFYEFRGSNNLHLLCKSLLHLKQLTSLSFHIFSSINFGSTHLETFSLYLQKLTTLHSLSLSIGESMGDDNYWIETVTPALPKLTSLTQIDIHFERTRMTHANSLVDLFRAFSTIKTLTNITLDLSFCSIPLEDNTIEPLAEGIQCLNPSLIRVLKIFPNENLTDEGLIQLSQALNKFTALQVFHLGLYRPIKITDMGVTELTATLSRLVSLISFSLSFYPPSHAQKTVQSIASALMFLQNLIYLKLGFHGNNTTHDQVEELSSSLRILKPSLQFLEISLAIQKSLTDSTVEDLSETIKELTLLKHLTLSFALVSKVTVQGLEALCLAIQQLSNLSFLALDFSQNTEINEIHALSQVIRNMPSLDSVDFRFMRCSQLHEGKNGFQCLFTALKEVDNIRRVSLSIPRSDQNFNEVDNLSRIKNVQISWF